MLQSKLFQATKSLSKRISAANKSSKFGAAISAAEAKLEKTFSKSKTRRELWRVKPIARGSFLFKKLDSALQKINALYSSRAIGALEKAEKEAAETEHSASFALLQGIRKSLLDSPVKTISVFLLATVSGNIAVLVYRQSFDLFSQESIIKLAVLLLSLFGLTVKANLKSLLQTSAFKKALSGRTLQKSG